MEKTKTSAALGQGKKDVSCPEGIYLGYGCRVWEDVKGLVLGPVIKKEAVIKKRLLFGVGCGQPSGRCSGSWP